MLACEPSGPVGPGGPGGHICGEDPGSGEFSVHPSTPDPPANPDPPRKPGQARPASQQVRAHRPHRELPQRRYQHPCRVQPCRVQYPCLVQQPRCFPDPCPHSRWSRSWLRTRARHSRPGSPACLRETAKHQEVTERPDLAPGHFRVLVSQGIRERACDLAQQKPRQHIGDRLIGVARATSASGQALQALRQR